MKDYYFKFCISLSFLFCTLGFFATIVSCNRNERAVIEKFIENGYQQCREPDAQTTEWKKSCLNFSNQK